MVGAVSAVNGFLAIVGARSGGGATAVTVGAPATCILPPKLKFFAFWTSFAVSTFAPNGFGWVDSGCGGTEEVKSIPEPVNGNDFVVDESGAVFGGPVVAVGCGFPPKLKGGGFGTALGESISSSLSAFDASPSSSTITAGGPLRMNPPAITDFVAGITGVGGAGFARTSC